MHELTPRPANPQREPHPVVPLPVNSGWMSTVSGDGTWNACAGLRANVSGGLLEYWHKIRAHKWALAFAAAAGLAAGLLWFRATTPVYRGRASIEVFQKSGAEVPVDPVPNEAFVRTQIKIIESESLLARAARRLRLTERDVPADKPGWAAEIKAALGQKDPAPQTEDGWAAFLGSAMKVRSPDATRMVEITFDSENSGFCSEALNAILAEYIATTAGTRENLTEETSAWLLDQLASMRRNLESAEATLLNYAARNHLVLLGEKDNVAEETLRQLHAELARAEAEKVTKQSRQELAISRPATTLPEVLDNGPLREYEVKLTELRRQFAEVSHTYTPEHYRYERLQAQIQEVEQAIQQERANVLKRIQNEYESADRRRQMLEERYAAQVAAVGRQSRELAQYNLLKREVDTNRQVYESTLQRLREYRIQSALHANHVRVIDQPRTPSSPHWPKMKWTVALGLLAGLVSGFAGVLVRESTRSTIQRPGQAGALLGTPELGVIPEATTPAPTRLLRLSGPSEVERWKDVSFPADSFRSTLTSILFARREGRPSQTLVVTSALPREGKTMSTSHLGIALAESGERVLIIDADTRKPRIHDMFGIENRNGLADLLSGKPGADAATSVRKTVLPTLDVLPAGQPAGLAWVQVLYSRRWADLLQKFRAVYNTILIDSPPLLHLPDARVLGKLADAMVLVVRANETQRDAIVLARQRLAEDGINLLGVILNGWHPAATGYDSYAAYGYQPKRAAGE